MTTYTQKVRILHITRILIFILGSLSILIDTLCGDILGVLSLFVWLWMPKVAAWELKLLEKWV